MPILDLQTESEPSVFWLQPWKWVDHDDWLELQRLADPELKQDYLRELLRDMIVNRKTELTVFIRNYMNAESYVNGTAKALTRRQEEAVRARSEALLSGRDDITLYVADELGIHRSNAAKLLARADVRLSAKIATNMLHNAYIDRTHELAPHTKQAIEHWMRTRSRQCAGDGRPETKMGRLMIPACERKAQHGYELCYGCYKVYGNRGGWPQWLYSRAASIRREHYQDAIESLLRAGDLDMIEARALEELRSLRA